MGFFPPMLGTIIKLGKFEEMRKIKDTNLKEYLVYIIFHGHIIFNGHSNYEKSNHFTRCLGVYAKCWKMFSRSTMKNYPTTPSNKLNFTMAQINEIQNTWKNG